MRTYFDDYGCMRCGRSEVSHKANGMCHRCHSLIRTRLERSAVRRMKPPQISAYARKLVENGLKARDLLKDLCDAGFASETGHETHAAEASNPVLEVFDRLQK